MSDKLLKAIAKREADRAKARQPKPKKAASPKPPETTDAEAK